MAVGVEYLHHDRTERAMANSEVILRAGAFNSPRILMLSIGPEPELAKHGIPVNLASLDVGANLQDHTRTGMSAPFEDGHSSGNRLQFHCLANHLQQARSIIFFTKRVNGPISRFLSQFCTKLRVVI
jgi:choline dehydrogenase-like flavoprotein